MNKRYWSVVLAVLVISLQVPSVWAEREATVIPLESTDAASIQAGGPRSFVEDCQVGNLNPPAFSIGGWALPPEEYALLFDPSICTACPDNININSITVVLNATVACTVSIAVDVEEVGFPLIDDCGVPGPEICISDSYTIGFPATGVYVVQLPIDCPCLSKINPYMLSFHYESSTCTTPPSIVTDEYPTPCTSWNYFGGVWTDLVTDVGFPGNLSIYAGATCCEGTATEKSSWGKVKKLYR